MISRNQTTVNLITQIVSFLVNTLLNYFLTSYIVESIGVEAFGFIGLSNDFIQYLQLFSVAINSMASRIITIRLLNGDLNEARQFYSSVILGNLILVLLLLPFVLFAIINLSSLLNISSSLILDVKVLFFFIFLNFIVSLISSAISISLFALNKLYVLSIVTTISLILKSFLIYALYSLGGSGVWIFGFATFLVSMFVLLRLIYYRNKLMPYLLFEMKFFKVHSIIDLISSGIWSSVSKLSALLSSGLDLLIANIMINPMSMGVLSIAKIIPNQIISGFSTISSTFAPQLTIDYASKDKSRLLSNAKYYLRIMGIISILVFPPFYSLSAAFYSLWVPKENIGQLYTISLIATIHLAINLPIMVLNNIYVAHGKLKAPAISVLVSGICTIFTELIFIPMMKDDNHKLVVIVLSSAVFEFFRGSIFIPVYVSRLLKIDKFIFYKQIISNLFHILVLSLFFSSITIIWDIYSWFELISIGVIITVILIFYIGMFVLNQTERSFIKHRLISFFGNI